jgi:hypothetical protein
MKIIEELQQVIDQFEYMATKLSMLMEMLDPESSNKPIGEKCKAAKHALAILKAGANLTENPNADPNSRPMTTAEKADEFLKSDVSKVFHGGGRD